MSASATGRLLVGATWWVVRGVFLGLAAVAGGIVWLQLGVLEGTPLERVGAYAVGALCGAILADAVLVLVGASLDRTGVPGLTNGIAASAVGLVGLVVAGNPGLLAGIFVGAVVGDAV